MCTDIGHIYEPDIGTWQTLKKYNTETATRQISMHVMFIVHIKLVIIKTYFLRRRKKKKS